MKNIFIFAAILLLFGIQYASSIVLKSRLLQKSQFQINLTMPGT